jgi:trehalose 6-phosphate phosphatase
MSVELHPPLDVDKGTVVTDRAAGMTCVAYVGDDEGDLPAFEALDRLAALGAETLKVAVASTEASPRLLEAADVTLDGPDAVVALLRSLS